MKRLFMSFLATVALAAAAVVYVPGKAALTDAEKACNCYQTGPDGSFYQVSPFNPTPWFLFVADAPTPVVPVKPSVVLTNPQKGTISDAAKTVWFPDDAVGRIWRPLNTIEQFEFDAQLKAIQLQAAAFKLDLSKFTIDGVGLLRGPHGIGPFMLFQSPDGTAVKAYDIQAMENFGVYATVADLQSPYTGWPKPPSN